MNETNTNSSHSVPEERILLVLHNALHQFAPLNLTIGDIVLTERSFYFVRYGDFQYSGSLGKGAGFLIGGLAGGIATSIGERDKLTNARDEANEIRSKLFGFPLRERVTQYSQSFVHPFDVTERLRTSDETEVSLTLRDGKRLDFVVPPMNAEVQDVVNNWPTSKGQYDVSSDPEGFLVGSASPRELLARVEGGDSTAAAEVYRLGQSEKYAVTIYSELQTKTETERQALYRALSDGPGEFRESLIAVAKKESRDGIGKIVMGSIGVVWAVGFLGWIAISQDSIFMWFMAAGVAFLLGMLVVEGMKKIQRAKEAKGYLC